MVRLGKIGRREVAVLAAALAIAGIEYAVLHGWRPFASPAEPSPLRIRVRRGLYGAPIPGATVDVTAREGWANRSLTDGAGVVTITNPPHATLRIAVSAAGFENGTAERDLTDPEADAEVEFPLESVYALHGTVVDAQDGSPVTGASIEVREEHQGYVHSDVLHSNGTLYGTAVTDAAGDFAVDGLPHDTYCESQVVRVVAAGHRTVWWFLPEAMEFEPEPWPPFPVHIPLPSGGTVTGSVRGPDGAPVAGATVVAGLEDLEPDATVLSEGIARLPDPANDTQETCVKHPELQRWDAWGAVTPRTDSAGAFTLAGLGLGERYALAARALGFAPSVPVGGLRVRSASETLRRDLTLGQPCTVVVRCVDTDGRPRARVFSRVDGVQAREHQRVDARQGETDASGTARFPDLREGAYVVLVNDTANEASHRDTVENRPVRLAPGSTEVVFTLSPAPAPGPPVRSPSADERPQSLREELPPRLPYLKMRIALPDLAAPPRELRMRSFQTPWAPDATGSMLLTAHLEGNGDGFCVQADGYVPIVRDTTHEGDVVLDFGTVTLDPGPGFSGVVMLSEGHPLGGVQVDVEFPPRTDTMWPRERSSARDTGDYSRRFRRHALTAPDGTFRLVGIPRGDVAVGMRDPRFLEFETRAAVPASPGPARFVVRGGSLLTVTAVDEDGNPVPRCTVEVRTPGSTWEDPREALGETDSTGRFRVRLASGRWHVDAHYYAQARESPGQRVQSDLTLLDGIDRDLRMVILDR